MADIENYSFGSEIAKHMDVTYSHINKLLQRFQDKGWVTLQKTGRLQLITVTEAGKEVSKVCRDMVRFSE